MVATKLHSLIKAARMLPERLLSRHGNLVMLAGASFCLVPSANTGITDVPLRTA